MKDKIDAVVNNLNCKIDDFDFIPHRDANKKRFLLISEIDESNQYLLAIPDTLIQDNSTQALKLLTEKLIDTIKENTNKIIAINSDHNINIE